MCDEANPLLGKWRITGMELWNSDVIDLLGPGFIRFDADGGGEFVFGAVQAGLDCEFGAESAYVTWEGSDEMDPARGDGDAQIEEDGSVSGEIRFHRGDDSAFTARRW